MSNSKREQPDDCLDGCFAVDIGNSGLRISKLDLVQNTLGDPFRIIWRQGVDGTPGRYLPSESAWVCELEQYITAQTSDRVPGKTTGGKGYQWLVSSVRADASDVLRDFVASRPSDRLRVISWHDVPLRVNVKQPDRLGIDRLLAAWAAAECCPARPIVVIQAGSAVTVDLVDRQAEQDTFEGGAILPGVPMMLRLLGQAADMLPEVDADDLIDLPALPGKDTVAAMTCGAASGLVGGVQHLVQRYRAVFGAELQVILSGGDGMRLSPHISQPLTVEPHLVQRGLLLVAQDLLHGRSTHG